jgi:hypothetical protein
VPDHPRLAPGPLTHTGEFLGTPAYAAPEQVAGDPAQIDIRTDVYALGVILYEMLCGQLPHPFRGSLVAMLQALLEETPIPPSTVAAEKFDELLDAIALKALAREREQRYQSAGALAEDVEHYLAGEPIQARPPGLALLLRSWLKQNVRATVRTMLIGLGCGSVTALAVGIPRLLPLLNNCAQAYARFPRLQPPWLAIEQTLPDVALQMLSVLGAIAFVCMGLFTALLVKPKARADDMLAGLATGLVGGLTAFIISGGWATVQARSVFGSMDDLRLLGRMGSEDDGPILQRYPDLGEVPPDERGRLLVEKIVGDQVVGIPVGITLGVVFTLAAFGLFGVLGTRVAGALLRRGDSHATVVFAYLEATFASAWLILLGFLQIFYPSPAQQPWLVLAVVAALAYAAVVGVQRGWRWPVRGAIYGMGLVLISILSGR